MARLQLDLPTNFVFEIELDVRITDINHGGRMGNDRVLSLIHEARARFFASHGLSDLDIDGLEILVADALVIYRAEAFFGDRLQVQLAGQDFNRYGCDLVYRLSHCENGREIARAKTGVVFFDSGTRKIASAPQRFRELFPNAPIQAP
jgi:acyl-CoA thioester hydrolase